MALILCDSVIFSLALEVELAPSCKGVEFTPHNDRERSSRADSSDRDKTRDRSPSAGEGDFVLWGCLRTLRRDQSHVFRAQW